MKQAFQTKRRQGFTLIELMVAMVITSIIVVVLVSVTRMALDTWNRSRSELRASRQGKALIAAVAKDFESMVYRSGNTNEWLFAELDDLSGNDKLEMGNAFKVVFFSAPTDRYDGKLGTADDLGGDVCAIAYQLAYRDPIDPAATNEFKTYIFNRLLVDPKPTFDELLGEPELDDAFGTYESGLDEKDRLDGVNNFICENIYQFTLKVELEVTKTSSATPPVTTRHRVALILAPDQVTELRIKGSEMTASGTMPNKDDGTALTPDELKTGKLKSVEISVTVLTDRAVDQVRNRSITGDLAAFLLKNSYQFSRSIQLPSS
ncbi:MAG: prepilin-type N-terminal cleavage/methylation domain-containing protein [Verrucomicrobiota bacterium]